MSRKTKFKQSIYFVCKHNRHGSFETQGQCKQMLMQIADELHACGFKLTHIRGLRQRHMAPSSTANSNGVTPPMTAP